MITWWLSFADGARPKGTQLLGVCIVDAPDFGSAISKCWELKINPGGEVQGFYFPPNMKSPDEYKNRLLTRAEAEEAENHLAVGDA